MPDLFDKHTLTVIILAGLFGGVVRGYSGFGFALAAMPILTIAISPTVAVPAVFPLEFFIGLLTLPIEHKNIDLNVLKWLGFGALIGTPIGITILTLVPNEVIRSIVGLAVAAAVYRAWKGDDAESIEKTSSHLCSIGFLSGCLNGGTGMSGPPVIVSLLGSTLPVLSARATLIAFIAMSACFGFVTAFVQGAYLKEVWLVSAIMAPAVAIGCVVGITIFSKLSKHLYRGVSLSLLGVAMMASVASIAWALVQNIAR